MARSLRSALSRLSAHEPGSISDVIVALNGLRASTWSSDNRTVLLEALDQLGLALDVGSPAAPALKRCIVLLGEALSFAGSADTVEALTRFNAELGRSGLTFLPEMLTALQSMSLRGEGTGQAVELALVPLQAVIESPEVDVLQQCCAAACSLLLRFLSQLRVPKDDIGPVVSAMLAACAVAKDACDVVTRTSAVCPVVLADLLSVCRSQPATLSTMYFISHCVSVGLAEPSILVSMCRPNPQHITQLLLADTSHPLFLPTVQAMLSVLDCHEIDHQSMAGLVAVLGSVCEGVGPWTPSAVAIQALLCASLVQDALLMQLDKNRHQKSTPSVFASLCRGYIGDKYRTDDGLTPLGVLAVLFDVEDAPGGHCEANCNEADCSSCSLSLLEPLAKHSLGICIAEELFRKKDVTPLRCTDVMMLLFRGLARDLQGDFGGKHNRSIVLLCDAAASTGAELVRVPGVFEAVQGQLQRHSVVVSAGLDSTSLEWSCAHQLLWQSLDDTAIANLWSLFVCLVSHQSHDGLMTLAGCDFNPPHECYNRRLRYSGGLVGNVPWPGDMKANSTSELIFDARVYALLATMAFRVMEALIDRTPVADRKSSQFESAWRKLSETSFSCWRLATCCIWILRCRVIARAITSSMKGLGDDDDDCREVGQQPGAAKQLVISSESILENVQRRIHSDRKRYSDRSRVGGASAVVTPSAHKRPHDGGSDNDSDADDFIPTDNRRSAGPQVQRRWYDVDGMTSVTAWCEYVEGLMRSWMPSDTVCLTSLSYLSVECPSETYALTLAPSIPLLVDGVAIWLDGLEALIATLEQAFQPPALLDPNGLTPFLRFRTITLPCRLVKYMNRDRVFGSDSEQFELVVPSFPPETPDECGRTTDVVTDALTVVRQWLACEVVASLMRCLLQASDSIEDGRRRIRMSTVELGVRVRQRHRSARLVESAVSGQVAQQTQKAVSSVGFELRQSASLHWMPSDVVVDVDPSLCGAADDDGAAAAPESERAAEVVASTRTMEVIAAQLITLLVRLLEVVAAPEHHELKGAVFKQMSAAFDYKSATSDAACVFNGLSTLLQATSCTHVVCGVLKLMRLIADVDISLVTNFGVACIASLHTVRPLIPRVKFDHHPPSAVDVPLVTAQSRTLGNMGCMMALVSAAPHWAPMWQTFSEPSVYDPLPEDTSGTIADLPEFVSINLTQRSALSYWWSISHTIYPSLETFDLAHVSHAVYYAASCMGPYDLQMTVCTLLAHLCRFVASTDFGNGRPTLHVPFGDSTIPGSCWHALKTLSPDSLLFYVEMLFGVIAANVASCPLGVLDTSVACGIASSSPRGLSVDEALGIPVPLPDDDAPLSTRDRVAVRLRRWLSLLRLLVSLIDCIVVSGGYGIPTVRRRMIRFCVEMSEVTLTKSLQVTQWRPTTSVHVASKHVHVALSDLRACAVAIADVFKHPLLRDYHKPVVTQINKKVTEINSALEVEGLTKPDKYVSNLTQVPTGSPLPPEAIWQRLLLLDEATLPRWHEVTV